MADDGFHAFRWTERAQRIVGLVESFDSETFLFLPVQFSMRRRAKLPAGDFSIER
jgi:hypothetical protein